MNISKRLFTCQGGRVKTTADQKFLSAAVFVHCAFSRAALAQKCVFTANSLLRLATKRLVF